MIFSRSPQNSNAYRRGRMGVLSATLTLAYGCAVAPSIPANVILHDAHNISYVVAFDNRSETLASGGSEGRIRLWRLPEGKEQSGWKAHTDSVEGLKFLNHERELLSASYDGTLARWTRDGKLLARVSAPSPITGMAADETAGLVVTGHYDGYVRLWRLDKLALETEQRVHRGRVRAVAFRAADEQFASSGTDGRVFRWRRGEAPQSLPAPPTDSYDLAFSPDGKSLMGGGWFKLFRWRLDDGALTVLDTEHRGIVKSIDYSRDGDTLVSISRQLDSSVYFLDAQTGAVTRRFQPHELCGTSVRLSPNGRYIATTADDASVRIWDLQHPLPPRNFYNNETVNKRE